MGRHSSLARAGCGNLDVGSTVYPFQLGKPMLSISLAKRVHCAIAMRQMWSKRSMRIGFGFESGHASRDSYGNVNYKEQDSALFNRVWSKGDRVASFETVLGLLCQFRYAEVGVKLER